LGQAQTNTESDLEKAEGDSVEQVVEMCAASIQTAVTATLKQDTGKVEDALYELAISIG
jgi:hypothetical protein